MSGYSFRQFFRPSISLRIYARGAAASVNKIQEKTDANSFRCNDVSYCYGIKLIIYCYCFTNNLPNNKDDNIQKSKL